MLAPLIKQLTEAALSAEIDSGVCDPCCQERRKTLGSVRCLKNEDFLGILFKAKIGAFSPSFCIYTCLLYSVQKNLKFSLSDINQ